MRRAHLTLAMLMMALTLCLAACNSGKKDEAKKEDDKQQEEKKTGHGHDHGDELFWERDGIEAGDGAAKEYTLQLGRHGAHVDQGHEVELAATVMKDDAAVSDAKVFVSIVTSDGAGDEVEMKFEEETKEEPAHYAQANLTAPKDAEKMTIRYRIELPGDAGEVAHDVVMTIEKH